MITSIMNIPLIFPTDDTSSRRVHNIKKIEINTLNIEIYLTITNKNKSDAK